MKINLRVFSLFSIFLFSQTHANQRNDLSFYAECVAKNTFEHTQANTCVSDAIAYEKQTILDIFLSLQRKQDKDSKTLYKHVTENHKIWKKHVDEECEFQAKFFDDHSDYCYLRHYEQRAKEIVRTYKPRAKTYD